MECALSRGSCSKPVRRRNLISSLYSTKLTIQHEADWYLFDWVRREISRTRRAGRSSPELAASFSRTLLPLAVATQDRGNSLYAACLCLAYSWLYARMLSAGSAARRREVHRPGRRVRSDRPPRATPAGRGGLLTRQARPGLQGGRAEAARARRPLTPSISRRMAAGQWQWSSDGRHR